MKVEVNVDEQLVESALRLSGLATQNEVIEEALKSFVQLLRQESIKTLCIEKELPLLHKDKDFLPLERLGLQSLVV